MEDKHAEGEAAELKLSIDAYNAYTNRLKVTGANEEQVQAIVMQMLQGMALQPMPIMPEGQELADVHAPEGAMSEVIEPQMGEQEEPQEPPEMTGMEY